MRGGRAALRMECMCASACAQCHGCIGSLRTVGRCVSRTMKVGGKYAAFLEHACMRLCSAAHGAVPGAAHLL